MKLGSVTAPTIQPVVTKTAATTEPAATEVIVDKVQRSEAKGSDTAQYVKMAATGLGTVALAVPAMYAGSLGGAIVGSSLGIGTGAALAAISSTGALDFLKTTFAGTGTGAKIGIVIGTLSGIAGAYAVGKTLGNGAARVLGGEKDPVHASSLKEEKRVIPSLIAGIGGTAGVVGGGIIGAGVFAAGSVMANGFQNALTVAPGAALTGGIAGAVLFGLLGGMGGVQIAETSGKVYDGGKNLVGKLWGKTGDNETLEAKAARVKQVQAQLTEEQKALSQAVGQNHGTYLDNKATIDQREAGVVEKETDVKQREAKIDGTIEAGGQAKFHERSQDLRDWKDKLDTREAKQNKLDSEIQAREAQINKEVTAESDKIFAQRRGPLEQHYNDLKNDQDTRESKQGQRDRQLDQEIENRFQNQVAAPKSQLQNEISNAQIRERAAQQEQYQAQGQANQARNELQQATDRLDDARRAHSQAQSEENSLINSTANLRSQLSSLQSQKSQLDAKERDIEARERK